MYFDEIIQVVKDIKRIKNDLLEDLPEWFNHLLHQYQNVTKMTDKKICQLFVVLNRQINKLKKIIKETK